jgi:antitoxin YefM
VSEAPAASRVATSDPSSRQSSSRAGPKRIDAEGSDRGDRLAEVAIILVMSETMSLADVKARFSEVVDRVERQQDRVVVTRNGKPAAVLISPDDLASLEETLTVMSDRSLARQVRESEEAIAAGEAGSELGELRADLERRRAARK